MLILTALVLGYVSLLLMIRLSSLGIPRPRVRMVIAELWIVFALIIAALWEASRLIGAVPRSSVAEEIGYLLTTVTTRPLAQQVLIFGGLLLAVAVLVHFLWSLHDLQRGREISPSTYHGED